MASCSIPDRAVDVQKGRRVSPNGALAFALLFKVAMYDDRRIRNLRSLAHFHKTLSLGISIALLLLACADLETGEPGGEGKGDWAEPGEVTCAEGGGDISHWEDDCLAPVSDPITARKFVEEWIARHTAAPWIRANMALFSGYAWQFIDACNARERGLPPPGFPYTYQSEEAIPSHCRDGAAGFLACVGWLGGANQCGEKIEEAAWRLTTCPVTRASNPFWQDGRRCACRYDEAGIAHDAICMRLLF